MLLKFFNRGTGKGKAPVEYLLKKTDSKGVRREPAPELLRGDPQQIVRLIDSLDFKHKYNSGVISFAPEDAPSPEQLEAIMDSFEEVAFAGLARERYSILWVRHTHTGQGRVELHFVTPRVELTTGKSLNIAPPGWENYFRPWRDYWNSSQGWASPDDPARARAYHPGYQALIDAENSRLELAGKSTPTREDSRKIITNYIAQNIRLGRIKDRLDVVSTLEKAGLTITRKGDNYLTVFSEQMGKRLRLKGGVYDASWRLGEGLTAEARGRQETNRGATLTSAREAETELRKRVQERLEYHQSRYGKNEADSQCSTEVVSSPTRSDTYQPLSRFLYQQLGDGALVSQPSQRDSSAGENLRNAQEQDLGSRTLPDEQRKVYYPPTVQPAKDQLAVQWKTLFEAVEGEDERVRKRVATDLQELCQGIREGQEATASTSQQLSEANSIVGRITDQLNQQSRATVKSLSRCDECLRRISLKRTEELEQFKSDINLVEYAQSLGYEIDRKKSSQNCIVLKDHAGDKILVGVAQADNHYFYYSVWDETDKGSIIDFVQKRKNLNLGEVRKELRAWRRDVQIHTSTREPIPKPIPAQKDRHEIIAQFEGFQTLTHHSYLNQRGISQETINSRRFSGTIYTDSRSNAIFPHQDRDGICGYEIRNQQFKGFSRGGSKGLWCSNGFQDDRRLVICESPIDCLSYHQLFADAHTRYFATGGTLSEKQKDLLRGAFEKIHAKGGEISIATDRDEAGQEIARQLKEIAPQTARMSWVVPEHHKDWNEALQAQREWERQQHRSRDEDLSL